ncbi:hypothetical protein D9756_001859 [Leucocoprinus leucothites]|uniref:NYN domain-containing protein n=1 Tax=Leucocoprinus leucothites TaxID=201217 RepID=A0A8H5G494_9AGAR|nr:hypothetical protein D9756_001859 [Leucoagaricus leucothites]
MLDCVPIKRNGSITVRWAVDSSCGLGFRLLCVLHHRSKFPLGVSMPQPKVKVFWDLETCPPPTSSYTSPWEILKDFRLFTSHFGAATTTKAYYNSNKPFNGRNDPSMESFRAALPSMGVSLVDCSSVQGYSKVTPTKMLVVDALVSAIDGSMGSDDTQKDIIMIISGDDSALYPISLLVFRNYTVFLVVPDDGNKVQPVQASRIFNWHRDVLGFKLGKESPGIAETEGSTLQSTGFSRAHIVRDTNRGAPPSQLGAAAASTPSVHSSLSRGVRSDATLSITPRSNVKSLPTSEPSDSRAPSVSRSDSPDQFESFPSLTVHDEHLRTKSKPAASDIQSHDMDLNYGWETGESGNWGTNGGWDAANNPWGGESAEESKKAKVRPDPGRADEPGPSQPLVGLSVEEQSDVPIEEVPLSVFDPLLQILRETKRRSMGRSRLGEVMAKEKGIYKTAKVKGFAEYIALAVAKDLIIARGTDNNQYVRLHPKLKRGQ